MELERFEMLQAIAMGLMARCPRQGCGTRVQVAPGGDASIPVECRGCEQLFCRACEVPWHEGATCDAFRRQQVGSAADAETADFLRAAATRCPTAGCNELLGIHERGHACHHITCGGCQAGYCYVCASPWDGGCLGSTECALFCDDNCKCPDCVECKPGVPCFLCSNDGRCRVCRPPRRGRG
jgi:hypothetical protein